MEMINVVSSNIMAIGWNEKKELIVEFKTGAKYEYKDVDEKVFKLLISAESVGKAFNAFVKGKYVYTKLV